jgi:hypothetical protein
VDLASIEAGLLPLARLVIADAHEMTYTVTAEGAIQVPRFNAVDRVAARSEHVLANDAKVSFFADVEKQNTPGKIGVKFRLQVRLWDFGLACALRFSSTFIHTTDRLLHLTNPKSPQDVPAPKDDEVQVDVYAAALNFRDVMIALSLLPEKSYEGAWVFAGLPPCPALDFTLTHIHISPH